MRATTWAGGSIYRDFLLILILSVILFLLIDIGSSNAFLSVLQLLIGFAYVLFIPGYCLTAALFPRDDDLDRIERIGLGLGLSIAWVPVLALILDYLPWGIDLWPIAVGEAMSILLFSLLAIGQRARLSAEDTHISSIAWHPRSRWATLPAMDRWIYVSTAVALLVASLSVAWVLLTPSATEVTTAFYMLGDDGRAESYPRSAVVGEDLMVTLGVVNREHVSGSYRVEVWVQDLWAADRRDQVAYSPTFVLGADEQRVWPITWVMPWPGQDQKVEFLLFAGEDNEPYRSLHLFVDVSENAGSVTQNSVENRGVRGR